MSNRWRSHSTCWHWQLSMYLPSRKHHGLIITGYLMSNRWRSHSTCWHWQLSLYLHIEKTSRLIITGYLMSNRWRSHSTCWHWQLSLYLHIEKTSRFNNHWLLDVKQMEVTFNMLALAAVTVPTHLRKHHGLIITGYLMSNRWRSHSTCWHWQLSLYLHIEKTSRLIITGYLMSNRWRSHSTCWHWQLSLYLHIEKTSRFNNHWLLDVKQMEVTFNMLALAAVTVPTHRENITV